MELVVIRFRVSQRSRWILWFLLDVTLGYSNPFVVYVRLREGGSGGRNRRSVFGFRPCFLALFSSALTCSTCSPSGQTFAWPSAALGFMCESGSSVGKGAEVSEGKDGQLSKGGNQLGRSCSFLILGLLLLLVLLLLLRPSSAAPEAEDGLG